jgi:hypothetical protein
MSQVRVLIVDDEPAIVETVQAYLEALSASKPASVRWNCALST